MSKKRYLSVFSGVADGDVNPLKIKADNAPGIGKFLSFLNDGSFRWIFANDPGTIDHNALLNYDIARHRKITEVPLMGAILIES